MRWLARWNLRFYIPWKVLTLLSILIISMTWLPIHWCLFPLHSQGWMPCKQQSDILTHKRRNLPKELPNLHEGFNVTPFCDLLQVGEIDNILHDCMWMGLLCLNCARISLTRDGIWLWLHISPWLYIDRVRRVFFAVSFFARIKIISAVSMIMDATAAWVEDGLQ